MQIGIIGAGNIGTNCAVQFLAGGHEVMLSFSRNLVDLQQRAAELGDGAMAGTPADAVAFGTVVVVSVPWPTIDLALSEAGLLTGKIVIDTTNQFADGGVVGLGGRTAARRNASRMPGARYTKSFNTITAGYQRSAAGRTDDERLVQWVAGDDTEAKRLVADLISDAGYVAVDLGGVDDCGVMEPPRRAGAVYGEEYRLADALSVAEAVAASRPIPPTPSYRPSSKVEN